MTDAQVKTSYLGDSVFVSEHEHDSTTICVFLNNGERVSELLITRKSEIVLEPSVAQALVRYIKERLP